jgi:7-cyano-7-deazaguanine synthase
MKRAVVLLSGGLDSATTLAIARDQQFEAYALSFDYGQRHKGELEAAKKIARQIAAKEHRIVFLDLRAFGGSALTDEINVPKDQQTGGIPITYVPARNTVFLSMALTWAEVLKAQDIFIGVNAVDYSGYPDCRPRFLAQFEKLAALATRAGIEGARFKVHAPLIDLSKAEIIAAALKLGVNLKLTQSCYDPVGSIACGHCDACRLRLKGFAEAGLVDPLPYAV